MSAKPKAPRYTGEKPKCNALFRPNTKRHAIAVMLLEAHARGEWPDADHVAARFDVHPNTVYQVRAVLRPILGYKGDRTIAQVKALAAAGLSRFQIGRHLRRSGTHIAFILDSLAAA